MNVQQVRVAGVNVEVLKAGKGKPVLYLHPGDGLDEKSPFLSRLASRFEVIAPSHPGFGGSELPQSYRTVDDLSYFYLDYLEQQGLNDVVIVGVSFGAWIAAEIAVKDTSRLAGLVLVDAVGAKFEGPKTREIADLFSTPVYERAQLIYENAALRKTDFSKAPEEQLVRLARNNESFALFGWSPTLHNPKLAGRLHRIDIPTQVLWGAKDRVVPPAYGRAFAKAIPNASFELIENAGHYPQVEQADRCAIAVEKFIDALPT